MKTKSLFTRFAEPASREAGRPRATILAIAVIVVWAVTGPIFHYSDTWQRPKRVFRRRQGLQWSRRRA